MLNIEPGRRNAETDRALVLFMVGMRINRLWKVHKWWPAYTAMPKMLAELGEDRELGLLSARVSRHRRVISMVQYWENIEKLMEFSRSQERQHRPFWKWFNQAVGSNGDVGIWHEVYHIRPGSYEARYVNMPEAFGLGAAVGVTPGTRAEPD